MKTDFIYFKLIRNSVACLICIAVGCRFNSSNTSAQAISNPAPVFPPVVIKTGLESGHPAGIRLSIQMRIETDTATTYRLVSSFEDRPIGLIVVLPGKDNGLKTESNAFFKSLGAPSDLFLQVLARQYNQHIDSSAKFVDSIPFICMNLKDFFHDKQDSLDKNNWVAAEYKLFFDSESIDGDAELFMNINTDHQWIEFAEKDEDYRAHLVRLFKQH